MTGGKTTPERNAARDRRTVLSAVWVALLFSFVYADIFTLFFDREAATQTTDLSSGSIIFFAVIMETAIAMVLLSRFLPYKWNRWANISVGIVQIGLLVFSLTEGTVTSFYAFFAALEIAALLFIVGYAWTWRRQPELDPVQELDVFGTTAEEASATV